jgi:hypothetical protein
MQHAVGSGQRRSPTAAIGHYLAQMYIGYCLPQMYEGFVRSPLPERLTQLLDEIERAEHAAAELRSLDELERFLTHARSIGTDPTDKEFELALRRLVAPRPRSCKTRRWPSKGKGH